MTEIDWGGQGTAYFSDRRNQLVNSNSVVEPPGVPFLKELIQNADDRNAKGVYLIFTESALYITNDGETFNYNGERDENEKLIKGDLFNLNSVKEKISGLTEEGRTGRHGTGFELVYRIGNMFEIHWRDRDYEERGGNDGRVSLRSNPAKLQAGGGVQTWDPILEKEEKIICPFDMDSRSKDMMGVLFKTEWRTEDDKEAKYGDYEGLFRDSVFRSWTVESKREYYDHCCNYAPFAIQFCKSIESLTLVWCFEQGSKIYEAGRSHCYSTEDYSGLEAGDFDTEMVTLSVSEAEFSMRDIRGPLDTKLFDRSLLTGSCDTIRMMHGWCSVHGDTGIEEFDCEVLMESWKSPSNGAIHAHNRFECPHCILGIGDWIPDRTSVVHIHFPIDDIGPILDRFIDPRKTLLHSILPLGVTTQNRFMISADLYVQENRKQCESDGDMRKWNSDCTRTSFWLHSMVFKELYRKLRWDDDSIRVEDRRFGLLQGLPTAIGDWWPTSVGIEQSGFPSEEDLLGTDSGELGWGKTGIGYHPLCDIDWIIDSKGLSCNIKDIVIPTNSDGKYDSGLARVLEMMELNVMTGLTFEYVLSGDHGTAVIEGIKSHLRKRTAFSSALDEETKRTIIEKAGTADWGDLPIDSKIALARLIYWIDSAFNGPVYPDDKGTMRSKTSFSVIPENLSEFKEIRGEGLKIHPELADLEVGEATVNDVLKQMAELQISGDERFKKLEPGFIQTLSRLADQILHPDSKAHQDDLIRNNFIPCRVGDRIFLRGFHHSIKCPECDAINPPQVGYDTECTNCDTILQWDDLEQRVNKDIPSERTDYQFSRTHIFSPDALDDILPVCVKDRIVTAVSGEHFNNRLVSNSKVGLIRFFGKKSVKGSLKNIWRSSLFDREELVKWLDMDNPKDDLIDSIRMEFLMLIKEHIDSGGGGSSLGDLLNEAPMFLDIDGEWGKAKDFVLYIDDVTLGLLNSKDEGSKIRVPHHSILDENRDANKWMLTKEFGGAKENVEFRHIEKSIRGLIGGDLDGFALSEEERFRKLAKIAVYIIKNPGMLEEKSGSFNEMRWVPIGRQDGFEEDIDALCKWEDFPLPTDEFFRYWGDRKENPHITLNGKLVSPFDYFEEDDVHWIRKNITVQDVKSMGARNSPIPERMFLCLLDRGGASEEDIESPIYDLMKELVGGPIPDIYREEHLRFFHPETRDWHKIDDELIIVETFQEAEILVGNCIPVEGLDSSSQEFLSELSSSDIDGSVGARRLIARLSERWSDIPDDKRIFAIDFLKQKWKLYLRDGVEDITRIQEDGDFDIIFPLENRGVAVKDIIFSDNGKILQFSGRPGVEIWSSRFLSQKEDPLLDLSRTSTAKALYVNGATMWSNEEDTEAMGLSWTEGIQRIKDSSIRIAAAIFSGGSNGIFPVTEEDGYDWNAAMFETQAWYSYRDSDFSWSVPLAYWNNEEIGDGLFISMDDSGVFLLEHDDPDYSLAMRFRDRGLRILHIRKEDEEYITSLPFRSDTEGPFPSFNKCMDRKLTSLSDSERDVFSPLSDYLKDVLSALEFTFKTRPIGDNPLSFLGELITPYRTQKSLTTDLKIGGYTIPGEAKQWTIVTKFSDPPVWPEIEVTFRTTVSESNKSEILREILMEGMRKRLRTTDAGIQDHEWLANALEVDISELSIAFLYSKISPLLEYPDPKSWSEIEGFEGIWENSSPILKGELVLNPEVSKAREDILQWYNDAGCQVCGQLTPDGPGSDTYEESRVRIFRKVSSTYIWRTAIEHGGSPGHWLYLCPTHHKLLAKKCLELYVIADGDWIEVGELVSKGELSALENIDEKRISVRCYERRGVLSPWQEEKEQQGAEWGERKEISTQRLTARHAKEIIKQIKEYVTYKIGSS